MPFFDNNLQIYAATGHLQSVYKASTTRRNAVPGRIVACGATYLPAGIKATER
jgi:hypothetical protein